MKKLIVSSLLLLLSNNLFANQVDICGASTKAALQASRLHKTSIKRIKISCFESPYSFQCSEAKALEESDFYRLQNKTYAVIRACKFIPVTNGGE